MMKRAIVTGATGFVGSSLCRYLVGHSWEVFIVIREKSSLRNLEDIKDKLHIFEYDGNHQTLANFFRESNSIVVFHLAALFIQEHNSDQIDDIVESNLMFGLHVLEAMKGTDTKLIINTGTSWQHYHSDEYNPVNLYAATKEAFQSLLKYYVEAEGLRAITLKLFDTYGELDNRLKLINQLSRLANENESISMSPGKQELNLIHVEDVVQAYLKAFELISMNNEIRNESYGVGSSNSIQLIKLVELFEKLSGKKLNILWGARAYRKREVMKLWGNWIRLPNWECKIDLVEGLQRVIKSKESKQ